MLSFLHMDISANNNMIFGVIMDASSHGKSQ
jgi:hypothetical protein